MTHCVSVSAPPRYEPLPPRQQIPPNFYVGDLVLCQYDAYPIWPAVIVKADDGNLKGKFRAVVPTATDGMTTAYHCYFSDDDSSAWIRADLIVKFHPNLIRFIRVAPSDFTFFAAQANALDEAKRRYADTVTSQAHFTQTDPISAASDQDRIAVVTMLGQWFLQTTASTPTPCAPRLDLISFSYEAALVDGRKLPHVLRSKLAPARMWPRAPLAAIKIPGQGEPFPNVGARCGGTDNVARRTVWPSETRRIPRGRKTLPVFEGNGYGRGAAPATAGATTATSNGTAVTAAGAEGGTSGDTKRKKRPRCEMTLDNHEYARSSDTMDGEASASTTISEKGVSRTRKREAEEDEVTERWKKRGYGVANYADGISETMECDTRDGGHQGRVGWGAMRTVETCQFRPAGRTTLDIVDLT